MLTYMLIQEIVHVIGCDRGKMSPKTLTLDPCRPPEQLLLAPEVATAVELLPARATACGAFVRAAVNLLNLRNFIWGW